VRQAIVGLRSCGATVEPRLIEDKVSVGGMLVRKPKRNCFPRQTGDELAFLRSFRWSRGRWCRFTVRTLHLRIDEQILAVRGKVNCLHASMYG
jgi:hypothetical protein